MPTPVPNNPTPVPGAPTTTSTAPGTAAGPGASKPHIVAAAPTKPQVTVNTGPAGSTALPPITDTPTPAPSPDPALDPSTLPTITAPSASAKPKATALATTNTSSKSKTFYIVGGIVFAAAVLLAAAVYGIRRLRMRARDHPPADEAAYLI